jgi:hypothetical protein
VRSTRKSLELSHPSVKKLQMYAALGVLEIQITLDKRLNIFTEDDNGGAWRDQMNGFLEDWKGIKVGGDDQAVRTQGG